MKILNKLTLDSLKRNKQRSIITIIGIILSTALIVATFSLISSLQETLKLNAIEQNGNQHSVFMDVESDDFKYFDNNKEIESLYYSQEISYTQNGYAEEVITAIDVQGIKQYENNLIEGKLPTNGDEIVVDSNFSRTNGIEVGQTFEFNIGDKEENIVKDATTGEEYVESATYTSNGKKTYTVTGIISPYTYVTNWAMTSLFTVSTYPFDNADIHVLYTNPADYLSVSDNLSHDEIGQKQYTVVHNDEFFRWAGYSIEDETMNTLIVVGSICALIIVATSIFCIRNSFAIAVDEKTRLYAMLSSVGATPRQLRMMVYKEGLIFGFIGIPIGILSALLASYILLEVTSQLLITSYSSSNYSFDLVFHVNVYAIIIGVVLGFITIFLSAMASARKAGKISEIEVLRNSKTITMKSSKMKAPNIIKKLFKSGGVLAYKNMKRNKSKYRTITISIAVSVITFISLTYLMNTTLDTSTQMYAQSNYDIAMNINLPWVEGSETVDYALQDKVVNEIEGITTKSRVNVTTYGYVLTDDDILSQGIKDMLASDPTSNLHNQYPNGMSTSIGIICIGNSEYQRILDTYNLPEDTKDKGILIPGKVIDKVDNEYKEVHVIDPNIKEITFRSYSDTETSVTLDLVYIEDIEVLGVDSDTDRPVILISSDLSVDDYLYSDLNVYIQTEDIDSATLELEEIGLRNNVVTNIINMVEMERAQANINLLFYIFIYGFLGVIILIGITSIFNTISANMKLRAKEFAMLQSIGMSKKEFKHMIRLECIFYCFKSLFWGILIGTTLSYVLYKLLIDGNIQILYYEVPVMQILVSTVVVILLVYMIMSISMSKINKQNLIETIKDENT